MDFEILLEKIPAFKLDPETEVATLETEGVTILAWDYDGQIALDWIQKGEQWKLARAWEPKESWYNWEDAVESSEHLIEFDQLV